MWKPQLLLETGWSRIPLLEVEFQQSSRYSIAAATRAPQNMITPRSKIPHRSTGSRLYCLWSDERELLQAETPLQV